LNIRASIPCGKYGLEANNENLTKRLWNLLLTATG